MTDVVAAEIDAPPIRGWCIPAPAPSRCHLYRTSSESGTRMSSPEPTPPEIATDLVEYLVLVIPGPDALAVVGPELVRIADSAAIRILDLAIVTAEDRGTTTIIEIDAIEGLDSVRELAVCYGTLLSRHDLDLVALALQPGDCAVVIVAEDRWAEPLAVAARALGGEVRAGERITRDRVEAALARARDARKGQRS